MEQAQLRARRGRGGEPSSSAAVPPLGAAEASSVTAERGSGHPSAGVEGSTQVPDRSNPEGGTARARPVRYVPSELLGGDRLSMVWQPIPDHVQLRTDDDLSPHLYGWLISKLGEGA